MVMHGAPGGFVRGFSTTVPHTGVLAADMTAFIAGIEVKSLAEIDSTNYLLVGVSDGTNGHVMTLDYSDTGAPTNPGNVAVSNYIVPNLHY